MECIEVTVRDTVLSDQRGTLNNSGGSIRFCEKGAYALSAAVTDKTGRVFTATEEIKVHPVARLYLAGIRSHR